jgi:hypothetical protein
MTQEEFDQLMTLDRNWLEDKAERKEYNELV